MFFVLYIYTICELIEHHYYKERKTFKKMNKKVGILLQKKYRYKRSRDK